MFLYMVVAHTVGLLLTVRCLGFVPFRSVYASVPFDGSLESGRQWRGASLLWLPEADTIVAHSWHMGCMAIYVQSSLGSPTLTLSSKRGTYRWRECKLTRRDNIRNTAAGAPVDR